MPSDTDEQHMFVSSIVFEEWELDQSEEVTESEPKRRLRDQVEDIPVGQISKTLVYWNQAGRSLLENSNDLKDAVQLLEKRVARNESTIDAHQHTIADLTIRIGQMTAGSENYLSTRRRFLDVIERDVFKMEEFENSKANLSQRHEIVGHSRVREEDEEKLERDITGRDGEWCRFEPRYWNQVISSNEQLALDMTGFAALLVGDSGVSSTFFTALHNLRVFHILWLVMCHHHRALDFVAFLSRLYLCKTLSLSILRCVSKYFTFSHKFQRWQPAPYLHLSVFI